MPSPNRHQTDLFGTGLLLQLDPKGPLLALAKAIPWPELGREFGRHYSPGAGRPGLPIRLMVGLVPLKQTEGLSGEQAAWPKPSQTV